MTTAFADRASALLPRLRSVPADPAVGAELQALRSLWTGLSDAERVEAAPLAAALAAAQAPPPRQPSLLDEDLEARRAITGLEQLDPDAAFVCRYQGPREPDALLDAFGLDSFRPRSNSWLLRSRIV